MFLDLKVTVCYSSDVRDIIVHVPGFKGDSMLQLTINMEFTGRRSACRSAISLCLRSGKRPSTKEKR